jgi:glycosyltransferase involved in cell wall biosynthesis
MTIGFYGNANNYPFVLARALRRLGHEVRFVIVSRYALNRPENRYADIRLPYPEWIHDCSSPVRWRLLLPGRQRRAALKVLNGCDFVILNEEGPSLAPALQVPHAVFFTGSDLEVFADARQAETLLPPWMRADGIGPAIARSLTMACFILPRLVHPQRAGIRTAQFVRYFPPGAIPAGDRLLSEIGVPVEARVAFLMTDCELIVPVPFQAHAAVRVFCAARLTWLPAPSAGLSLLDYKGSDVMIRGLGLFHRRHGQSLDIHLVRKGRDVAATAKLAALEGISEHITWHDEMTQQEILLQYQTADIVFDQLGPGLFGMATLDAMAAGRPVITNGRSDLIEPITGEPLPICQAQTPEEVCTQLARLVLDRTERERVGKVGRAYAERHFSADAAAAVCLRRIGSAPATSHPPPTVGGFKIAL